MMEQNEYIARQMYDAYCAAVGGKAFNGDHLPSAETFFADPTKEKQAKAWIAAADVAIELVEEHLSSNGEDPANLED